MTFRNRIAMSPMCQYSSVDGFSGEWHLVHLGSRAVGGAGLVMTEATAVSPEGRISVHDLGIWNDDHIGPFRRITDFLKDHGAIPGIQLAHAGRKGSRSAPWHGDRHVPEMEGGFRTVSSVAVPFTDGYGIPAALDRKGIGNVVEDFRNAAGRAEAAGFRVAEIHAAHGYLIHQFLSPLVNTRTDEYGGSFANRIRLLVEIARGIRKVWPDQYPLFVRLSCTDWHEAGWTIAESVELAAILKTLGVDLVDASSGGILPGIDIPLKPGYQVPFAETIRKETGIMTGAVGLITEPLHAQQIIEEEKADIVLLGREYLRDPHFALRAAHVLGADTDWPVQYRRGKRM